MVAAADTPEPILETKGPAPVAPPVKRSAKKAAAKKAAAKRAPAKKAAAKKAAAKRAPAKKAPAKKAAAKRAPAKKKATVASATAATVMSAPSPLPAHERPHGPAASPRSDRFAICAAVTEDMMNDLVRVVVGAGVPLEPLETNVALPAMGEVGLRLALTITGARFDLRGDDGGRVRIIVSADGDVSTRAVDFDGDTADAGIGSAGAASGAIGAMAMPTPPAPIPVRVEALVTPFIELREDGGLSLGLDVRTAELVSLQTDVSAPVPEGVDPAAWSGILAMFGLLFGSLGDGLFASLGDHVGSVGMELDAEVGSVLAQFGVAPGRAEISVSSGLLSIGLPAAASVRGRALPVPISGKRVGVGLATSVVDAVSHMLILRAVGDMPLPFELDVDLGEQQVSGRLRNARVLPDSFPDLRSSLRTQVRTRLLRGRLELSVQAAWLELPAALPSIFNTVSRRLGELISLAPIRVRFPARIGLPIIPDSTDTISIEIDDLRVTTDGVGVVISLA